MHETPADLLYSAEHHWVRVVATTPAAVVVRWGLTAHARHHLGELVAATLPRAGTALVRDEVYGEVESTTTVADLYAPLEAVVTAANDALQASPELVDAEPYGEGWLLTVTVALDPRSPGAASTLMGAEAYRSLVAAPDPRVVGRAGGRPLQ